MSNLPKFSPSSLGVYNECPVKWKYAYIDGLQRKGTKSYFEVGTYTHELFHHMYRAVQEGMKLGSDALYGLMEARMRQDLQNITNDNVVIMNTVQKIVRDYVFRQSPKIDGIIDKIVGVERTVSIQVTTPRGHDVVLEGIADLVYSTVDGRVRVRDHKTGAKDVYTDENIQINPQLLFYYVVLAKQGLPMAGVEISFANSYNYKDRQKQDFWKLYKFIGPYIPSSAVTNNFWDYLLNTVDTILEDTPRPSYGNQCGSCAFRVPCTMELGGQDASFYIMGQYDKRERSYTIPVQWNSGVGRSINVTAELFENAIEHSPTEQVNQSSSSDLHGRDDFNFSL